jgi:hypothetical protein
MALVLCIAGCGGAHLPLSPDDVLSPGGLFLIMPGDYGPAVDNQGELAEVYWRDVETCIGARHTPKAFPIALRRWLARADGQHYFIAPNGHEVTGYYDRRALYVMGHPGYSQSWRHEMAHHLFRMATGNSDRHHRHHEWRACGLIGDPAVEPDSSVDPAAEGVTVDTTQGRFGPNTSSGF